MLCGHPENENKVPINMIPYKNYAESKMEKIECGVSIMKLVKREIDFNTITSTENYC